MTSPGGLQSGAVGLFTCQRLIAFGLNLSPILADTAKLWDSALLKEREAGSQEGRKAGRQATPTMCPHTPQQGVRWTFTAPVCLCPHACVQEGIGVLWVLSEIDGVEQLLFYLIYL